MLAEFPEKQKEYGLDTHNNGALIFTQKEMERHIINKERKRDICQEVEVH